MLKSFLAAVLLSASVERFGVSCTRDFLINFFIKCGGFVINGSYPVKFCLISHTYLQTFVCAGTQGFHCCLFKSGANTVWKGIFLNICSPISFILVLTSRTCCGFIDFLLFLKLKKIKTISPLPVINRPGVAGAVLQTPL